jgi:hypothetical protein
MNRHDILNLAAKLNLDIKCVVDTQIPEGHVVAFAHTGHQIGHWVAIIREGLKYFLIDSYGLPNNARYNIKYLPDDYVWSNVNGQSLGTRYCGLYCVALFALMKKGYTVGQAIEFLYPEHHKNRDNRDRLHQVLGEHPDVILAKIRPSEKRFFTNTM